MLAYSILCCCVRSRSSDCSLLDCETMSFKHASSILNLLGMVVQTAQCQLSTGHKHCQITWASLFLYVFIYEQNPKLFHLWIKAILVYLQFLDFTALFIRVFLLFWKQIQYGQLLYWKHNSCVLPILLICLFLLSNKNWGLNYSI